MTIWNPVVPPGGIHSGSRILAPYGQTMTMTMTMTNYGDPRRSGPGLQALPTPWHFLCFLYFYFRSYPISSAYLQRPLMSTPEFWLIEQGVKESLDWVYSEISAFILLWSNFNFAPPGICNPYLTLIEIDSCLEWFTNNHLCWQCLFRKLF
jgi:hypothetical protein